MRGGDSFDNLTATDIGLRERRARRSRPARSEWSPFFGSIYQVHTPGDSPASAGPGLSRSSKLMTRSRIEILAAITAAIIILMMLLVAGNEVAVYAATSAPESGPATSVPEHYTQGATLDEQTAYMREPA